jgi:hypothetical protein
MHSNWVGAKAHRCLCSPQNSPGHHWHKNAQQHHPPGTTNGKYYDGHRLDHRKETTKPTSTNWMKSTKVPQPNRGVHRQFHRHHPKHQQIATAPISPPHIRRHYQGSPTSRGIRKQNGPNSLGEETDQGWNLGHPQRNPWLAIWWNVLNIQTTTSQMHRSPSRTKNNPTPTKTRSETFQKLHCHLQFATIVIPSGKPILGQLNCYMSSAPKDPGWNLVVTEALKVFVRDW